MVQVTTVLLKDDIDGSDADGTVYFALDGINYEIDLSAEHADALRESFAEWVAAARRATGRVSRRRAGGRPQVSSDAREIRTWAREQGIEVSDRGRIPAPVREAWEAATR